MNFKAKQRGQRWLVPLASTNIIFASDQPAQPGVVSGHLRREEALVPVRRGVQDDLPAHQFRQDPSGLVHLVLRHRGKVG